MLAITLLFLACLIPIDNSARAAARMLSLLPNGPGRPFTWSSNPVTEIGIADAREGTEITPTGSLFTGYGEMLFFCGAKNKRVDAPIRTLERGYLPIVHYHFRDRSVRYDVTLFSWALNPLIPYKNPINFIRVRAFNFADHPVTSQFTVGFRYSRGPSCFRRPSIRKKPGHYYQPGVFFDPNWVYGFYSNLATRSNDVLFTYPTSLKPGRFLTFGKAYRHPEKLKVTGKNPVLLVRYDLHLKAGDRIQLNFKMPVIPIAMSDTARLQQLNQLKLSDSLHACRVWWRRQIRGKGLQLYLNERKVLNTFRASLMYLMLARDRWPPKHRGGRPIYVQAVNKLQYHAFWLRDASYMVHAYDLTGHAHRASQVLRFFAHYQKPNGNFLSQPGQHDGWGEALWAYGQHYQLTGDRTFARHIFPRVEKAVLWLNKTRAHDSLHILPGGTPHDDELPSGPGRITGDNFYALTGLHEAILMARSLGHRHLAATWEAEYRNYHHVLFSLIRKAARENGGFIPPCIDTSRGLDWGNLLALFPHELLSPMNPLVTGTLRHAVAEYREGLMTYDGLLHHYLTMDNTESWIIRGQQRSALRDLYSILVHTSATQAGWEFQPIPWINRRYGTDLAPHGWFAADVIATIRNMLIRSHRKTLHLLSVLSPKWTQAGDILSVEHAPTRFGEVSLYAFFTGNSMTLHIDPAFRTPPAKIVVHLPWYVSPISATVDDRTVEVTGHHLTIPPSAHILRVHWYRKNGLFDWSYNSFVKRFEHAWNDRYFHRGHPSFGNGPHIWPPK
jgi:hypothetical protein